MKFLHISNYQGNLEGWGMFWFIFNAFQYAKPHLLFLVCPKIHFNLKNLEKQIIGSIALLS